MFCERKKKEGKRNFCKLLARAEEGKKDSRDQGEGFLKAGLRKNRKMKGGERRASQHLLNIHIVVRNRQKKRRKDVIGSERVFGKTL